MGVRHEFVLRRIVVGLDASAGSLAALEAATRLAARAEAELIAVFVEDINLLRAAALPDAAQVTLPSGAAHPLDASALEAHLRALAAEARRALDAAATRRRLRPSFRVVRGSVAAEVLAASLEADLLILGRASRSLSRRGRLGATAFAVAEGAGGPVLLLPPGASFERPVCVVYDAGPTAQRALAAAADLAATAGQGLRVITVAEDEETASRLEDDAASWLRERGIEASHERLGRAGLEGAIARLREQPDWLLVLGASSPLLRCVGLREFLDSIRGPVLLAR